MKQYLLIITGDCNDADYAHSIEVVNESDLLEIKGMLKSIRRVREVYGKYNPRAYKDHIDKLPYYGEVYDAIPDSIKYNYDEEDEDYDENESEWLKEAGKENLENWMSFHENYIPYGTSDSDYVHTLVSVEAYELANDKPISIL